MRNLNELNRWRRVDSHVVEFFGTTGNADVGMFEMPSPVDGGVLRVIATSGDGWDHVSVSRRNRCPNWPEMAFVYEWLFKPDEVAMQLGVPAPEHVNNHPYCLHWWRPHDAEIPRPPATMVGIKSEGVLQGRKHARELKRRYEAGEI